MVTDPQTHKQTEGITIHCAAASLARSVNINRLTLLHLFDVVNISLLFVDICNEQTNCAVH